LALGVLDFGAFRARRRRDRLAGASADGGHRKRQGVRLARRLPAWPSADLSGPCAQPGFGMGPDLAGDDRAHRAFGLADMVACPSGTRVVVSARESQAVSKGRFLAWG